MNFLKESTIKTNIRRNDTVDFIKGILIISVIIGHIISGGDMTHYIKYVIYSFHMPLFFGVSGYLLKKELFSLKFVDISKKYLYRLIIPFTFAYITYSLIEFRLFDPLYPWYHLWFIPAFLLFIIYLKLIEYLKISRTLMLFLLISFSILWIGYFGFNPEIDGFYFIGDKRFYYDFVFFFFGYYLRNNSKRFKINWFVPSILFIWSLAYLFILHNRTEISFIYSFNWVIFNLLFIYLTLKIARTFPDIQLHSINKIGQASLPIYLWHILSLLVSEKFFNYYNFNAYLYILLYFIGIVIVINIIYSLQNIKLGRILLFGEKK